MLDCGTNRTEESRILIGRNVAERVITRLHTNNFDPIAQPVLHLVGGVWVPGPTAPGPGKLRSAAFPVAS